MNQAKQQVSLKILKKKKKKNPAANTHSKGILELLIHLIIIFF